MKILVAEDDATTAYLIESIMSKYGKVDVVSNGSDALNMFLSSLNEFKKYDLICLDIMMPEMDGIETLKKIRQTEDEVGIPPHKYTKIVMITAKKDADSVFTSFKEQCDGYIVKPVDPQKVEELFKKLELI